VIGEPGQHLASGHRSCNEISLRNVGPEHGDPPLLRQLLDAFGDDPQPQCVPELDDRRHDRRMSRLGHNSRDEGTVDLQFVDGQGGWPMTGLTTSSESSMAWLAASARPALMVSLR
jgi:hypothetical protein